MKKYFYSIFENCTDYLLLMMENLFQKHTHLTKSFSIYYRKKLRNERIPKYTYNGNEWKIY